ncbi:MAG: alpha-ketoglutarate-dependent dioxygenase AlkB [Parvibaculaceae bacterium]
MTETLSLFPPTLGGPNGLRYQADFVSSAEEQGLIDHIRKLPLVPFQFGAYEGHRRVASFGWRYDYGARRLEKAQDIPGWLTPFIARVEALADPGSGPIRQVLCTEYDEGVGIGWHRDKPHFDEVFGLSLASACKFRFRRKAGASWERFTLAAEPRSLYRMTGEARNVWEHSIPSVEAQRYSITFRTMR